jgi:DNA-binding transcriptional regulator LsrR (DeoR family)
MCMNIGAEGKATGAVAATNTALLTSVARMYYLDGLGQSEIAQIYGVSRSKVSRLLTEARDTGIVRISVDEYDPRDRDLERRLTERFGLRHAIVVQGMGGTDVNIRRAVAYFAAPLVAEWVATQRTIGIAGGRTLGAVVHAMEAQPHGTAPEIVQLMGTIGSSPSSIDASELSRALARRFEGTFQTITAPAFVENARTRDLFLSHSQIRSVWSTFASMDLALVGVGTLEESVFVERKVLDEDDLQKLRKAGAVGEICGRFFDATGRECVTPYRDRVVSVDLDVLRERREVVAVTIGRNRGAAVRAALAGGLVTSLVIDDEGARGVLGAS